MPELESRMLPSIACCLIVGAINWRDALFQKAFVRLCDTRPVREIARLLLGSPDIDVVLRDLDRRVAQRLRESKKFTAVYAYEDGAVGKFSRGEATAVFIAYTICPSATGRQRSKFIAEETEREPEWAATLTGIRDSEEKLARKEEELKLAECVVVAQQLQPSKHCKTPDFTGADPRHSIWCAGGDLEMRSQCIRESCACFLPAR